MSKELETKVLGLVSQLSSIRADKHARHDSLTSKEEATITESIKSVNKDIVDSITNGAKECVCGAKPHGMVQYTALKGKSMPYFEIGCLACKDKRSQGFSIEAAVSDWNSDTLIK